MISIDNHHNSHPRALERVAQIARDSLPPDATEQDKESTVIDAYTCDVRNSEQVRSVFERYGQGGIWGVIHFAVRLRFALCATTDGCIDMKWCRRTRPWANLPRFL